MPSAVECEITAARANLHDPDAIDLLLSGISTATATLINVQDVRPVAAPGGDTPDSSTILILSAQAATQAGIEIRRTGKMIANMNAESRDPTETEWAELDRILKERLDALGELGRDGNS